MSDRKRKAKEEDNNNDRKRRARPKVEYSEEREVINLMNLKEEEKEEGGRSPSAVLRERFRLERERRVFNYSSEENSDSVIIQKSAIQVNFGLQGLIVLIENIVYILVG